MYISSVSLPVNEPYQTLASLRQSILCGYDNVTFLRGGSLICLIVLVVKLLTGFEALVPPVKKFSYGFSAVILDGTSFVQILKGLGASTVSEQLLTNDVFKTLHNIHFLCS